MIPALSVYPGTPAERDRWIVNRRGPREPVQADRPYAFLVERERFATGELGDVATLFLTNRECPWRCAMCDLWRHTLAQPVQPGDIPRQIAFALERLPAARQVKLYNSGSFFDAGAIPPEDYPAIAALLRGYERVIVESHPALVGEKTLRLRDLLRAPLEVAMGLETAHPEALERLNKRMTLDRYARASHWLAAEGIGLRSFVLVQPPFLPAADALFWACRSVDFAQTCGAAVVSLIPTRGGNGTTDELALAGEFAPPALPVLEEALEYGLSQARGRVFLDLWDIERVVCACACKDARIERLRAMNASQTVLPRVACPACGARA